MAFTILKLVGAAYLIWLGVQALCAARRHSANNPVMTADPGRRVGALLGFRQGLLSDLANPKIAVFFTSLMPQFVSPGEPVLVPFLLLGGLFVLITLVWLCTYALVAAKISSVLARPRVKAALDGLTGVVLIGLGIRVAFERR